MKPRGVHPQEELALRQGGLLTQLDSLEAAGQRHAAAAEAAWSALAAQAAALESRHADYAALTEALAASSSQLLRNSDQLAGAIEGVAVMHQHTRSLLRGMVGARWTLQVGGRMGGLVRGCSGRWVGGWVGWCVGAAAAAARVRRRRLPLATYQTVRCVMCK